ncbi:MAG: FHA domain-containing protein [Fusicatenibacter sp.]
MNETMLYTPPESSGTACLTVWDTHGNMQEYELKNAVKIGRATAGTTVDIPLNSSIASRSHGEFLLMDDGYCYRDTNSLNGTYINGTLYGRESDEGLTVCKLQDGDVLRIDQQNLNCTHKDAVLMIFSQSEDHRIWKDVPLTSSTGDMEIGRNTSAEDGIKLTDAMVSKRHATFRRGVNGWSVIDHDSTNGVFVNNHRIEQPTMLHRLDVIRIANTTFLFLGDHLFYNEKESSSDQLVIHIRERSVKQMFKKHVLLQDIHLTVETGQMVLILGGSGAGKTTFFNAVMGYEKADGQILHGDVDIYKEYAKMKYKIGFVPQQDLLREDDSVVKTLDNAARMKMPAHTTAAERSQRIDEVLELLGLQRERNSMVRKLSGGQKKRLSIAVEFIADPSLFFLDEPDSGLDGIMAASLMENLRVIADEGKIVMVITHAPDRVAHLFDKVVVLAKSAVTNSGHLAFFGSIEEAKRFFETDTLEGIVKRINRPDEGGDGLSDFYIEKYRGKGDYHE